MKLSIIGAGSWGTAMGIHLCRCGHEVVLWAYEPELVEEILAREEEDEDDDE